jgi:hypothetical protein
MAGIAGLAILVGCARDRPLTEVLALDEVVEWTGTIVLEEDSAVINVAPTVRIDGSRFLVADGREAQFRIYDADGGLVSHFGSLGDGPGEFRMPVQIARLPDGSLLAVDFDGSIAIYSDDGRSLVRTVTTPFNRIEGLEVIDDTLVYVAGALPGRDMEERIHVLDVHSGEVLRSFFQPPLAEEEITAVTTVGITGLAIRGDTIAATYALRDSVFFFTTEGRYLSSLSIPFRDFRPVGPPPPPGTAGAATRAWIDSFTMVSEVFWLQGGELIVQYQDRENMLPRWRLLGMTREGRRIFDLIDTPRLHAMTDDGERLYFEDPEALTGNVLRTGRLRIGGE